MLPPDLQNKDLTDMLPEVEDFTINELLPALSKGVPSTKERNSSKNSSLFWSFRKVVMQNNLDVPYSYFWKNCCATKVLP
jgi:hypothetical protein